MRTRACVCGGAGVPAVHPARRDTLETVNRTELWSVEQTLRTERTAAQMMARQRPLLLPPAARLSLVLLLLVAPRPSSPGRGPRMPMRRLSEDRMHPSPPRDSASDQIAAPDGLDGFRVHRARPHLDGRRGRGDAARGYMSDHNYDEDHWLAPTNPRTAFALHHASALGDVDEVMRLLKGCDTAHMRNCNQTAKGVDPDAKESAFFKTALHRAAEHDRYDVAVELIKHNASVNVTDKQYWTPLHKTAEKGWLEFSRLLLTSDADVGAVDKYGWTPLHRAADQGHLEVVKLLSAYGGPLDHGKASLGHFFPDVNAHANQDGTALHQAARKGHADIVAWLVGAGADIDARDKYGHMPLHKAAEAGQYEAARTLVILGAQKNTRGVVGGTPLQMARASGYVELAAMLASAGATTQTPLGEGLRSGLPHLNAEAYAQYEEAYRYWTVGENCVATDPTFTPPPDCGYTEGDAESCGAGCTYSPGLPGWSTKLGLPLEQMYMHHQVGLPSRYVYSSFVDESTGLGYRDEQHVGPELWAPGGTDENPDFGATGTYDTDTYSPIVEHHTVSNSVDVTEHTFFTEVDPHSQHILHTSTAIDGPVLVHPGAAHIDDGYRSGSYRPSGDARGYTTGGVDAGSRATSEMYQAGPQRGVEIGPDGQYVTADGSDGMDTDHNDIAGRIVGDHPVIGRRQLSAVDSLRASLQKKLADASAPPPPVEGEATKEALAEKLRATLKARAAAAAATAAGTGTE